MSVEEVDLVDRNEEGAEGGGGPLGTTLLQLILKVLERVPDIYVTAIARIRDDLLIEVISL
jgi:hypothetical protein